MDIVVSKEENVFRRAGGRNSRDMIVHSEGV